MAEKKDEPTEQEILGALKFASTLGKAFAGISSSATVYLGLKNRMTTLAHEKAAREENEELRLRKA
jgi:hypothetical protein